MIMTNKKMTNAMALETAIEVLREDNQYNEVVEKLNAVEGIRKTRIVKEA